MTETRDGGSVFGGTEVVRTPPSQHLPGGWLETKTTGLTVRDYFAGQALASVLAVPGEINDSTPATAARLSYRFADAMLAERAKRGAE